MLAHKHKLNKPLLFIVLMTYVLVLGMNYYDVLVGWGPGFNIESAVGMLLVMVFTLFIATVVTLILTIKKRKTWFRPELKLSTILLLIVFASLPIYFMIESIIYYLHGVSRMR